MHIISESWDRVLKNQYQQPYITQIQQRLNADFSKKICPKVADIWKPYRATPFEDVKVIILGDGPHYEPGHADGLAFSSNMMEPSLQIIFDEIKGSTGKVRTITNLDDWAAQGVFLLNRVLTTVQGRPLAHQHIGWDRLTEYTLRRLAEKSSPMVVMLWGKHALPYQSYFDGHKHLILKAPHPATDAYSTYSYTFRGCNHFDMANDYFQTHNLKQIRWADPI